MHIVLETLVNIQQNTIAFTVYLDESDHTFVLKASIDNTVISTNIFTDLKDARKYIEETKNKLTTPFKLRDGMFMDHKAAAEYDDYKMEQNYEKYEKRNND